MKLLFDQNISFRIIKKLELIFPDCRQVRELQLENQTDTFIWEFARQNGYCIVTFDSDFIDLSVLRGFPPKIIWLRMGNTSTENIAIKIHDEQKNIIDFLSNSDIAYLELD